MVDFPPPKSRQELEEERLVKEKLAKALDKKEAENKAPAQRGWRSQATLNRLSQLWADKTPSHDDEDYTPAPL